MMCISFMTTAHRRPQGVGVSLLWTRVDGGSKI